MRQADLQADCSRCAALCCVLLSFDKGESFAFDKTAGLPCRHLGMDHGCTIHENLTEKGFSGCVAFDCNGAGQRVVQDLFDGKSWRDDPALIGPMGDAFRQMRKIHELLLLLKTARQLPLKPAQLAELEQLESGLDQDWTRDNLARFDTKTAENEVNSFLQGLKDQAEARHAAG